MAAREKSLERVGRHSRRPERMNVLHQEEEHLTVQQNRNKRALTRALATKDRPGLQKKQPNIVQNRFGPTDRSQPHRTRHVRQKQVHLVC